MIDVPPPSPAEPTPVAAMRALARKRELHWRGHGLWLGRRRLRTFAPHLELPPEAGDPARWRAATDGLGLRLRLSDDELHGRLAPPAALSPVARALFGLFEQCRVESLVGDEWPGVQRNLATGFLRWSEALAQSRLVERANGLLLFAVTQAVHARVCALPVPEAIADRTESARARLAALVGPSLAALRATRQDQTAYALPARAIAETVARALAHPDAAGAASSSGRAAPERAAPRFFATGRDHDADGDDPVAPGGTAARGCRLPQQGPAYLAYTTAYDRELRPARGLRPRQLDEWRQQLDARGPCPGVNPARLAAALQRLLVAEATGAWAGAQEEGLIDGRRLARLVVSPTERHLFRQPLAVPQAQAAVSLLIDCSGSMRRHAESLAVLADVFARACDLAGVACEILGHSTAAWNGGRALRDWQRAGRPPHPGRLNELAHLIFKDARTSWRRARRDIAALLDPRLYREGIDGEALVWAAARLRAAPQRRRCLLVVADGCPMDSATQQANDPGVLDRHLQQVVAAIEDAGDIQLAAIGPSPELGRFYRRSRTVDLDAGPGPRVFQALLAALGPCPPR